MTDLYDIVRLNSEHLESLRELYKDSFHTDISAIDLKKKYDTSFAGVSYIGYIAYSKQGEPAAYYGVFPCFVEVNEKKVLAAQSGDTMTHSEHRGKGLFTVLAQKTYQLAAENDIKFIFGFPNKNSYPGFVNKLNWKHKEDINLYEVKLKTLPLAKIAKKFSVFQGLYRAFCKSIISKKISSKHYFKNSVIESGSDGVFRDKSFFEYKNNHQKYILELAGKCVWVKIDGYLWIGDIEYCTEIELKGILKKLKSIARYCGMDKIAFHTSPGTHIDQLFSKHLSVKKGLPIGYLDLNSGMAIDSIKYTSADFDTF